jgi:hypothetical protein
LPLTNDSNIIILDIIPDVSWLIYELSIRETGKDRFTHTNNILFFIQGQNCMHQEKPGTMLNLSGMRQGNS